MQGLRIDSELGLRFANGISMAMRLLLCAAFSGIVSQSSAADGFFEQTIFQAGTEGYHTYRIPAIIESADGTLLAFCEGRKNSSADHGDIDIVLKRSTDGGDTWGPLILVQEEGDTANITIGNPAPVVDPASGAIWLPFCRDNDRVFITSSTDDGLTWSARVEITADVKDGAWGWYATGPCHATVLKRGAHAGRLLIPCDHRVGGGWGSHVIYSDDHGTTWELGGLVSQSGNMGPNECVAVELVDGRVYLNARNQSSGDRRIIAYSEDGGETFTAPVMDEQLLEPTCQGSAVRAKATDAGDDENMILFSNPATTSSRTRMTVRRSYDETETWDEGKLIYSGPSAYSDLVKLSDGRIGLLFEKGGASPYETITFVRFPLSYLDQPNPPDADPGSAHWKMDEKAPGAIADTSPNAIRDTHRAGNDLHMTASGDLQYVAGDPRYGSTSALAFSGTQGLSIPDGLTANKLDFGPEDSFTIEALVRVPSGSSQIGNIVGKDVGANQPSWWFRIEDGRIRFFVDDGDDNASAWSETSINDGEWHHLAGVRDCEGGELRVYVDGALEDSQSDPTDSSLANGNAVSIGVFNSGTRQFTGEIDFVRISNKALPAQHFVPMDHDGDGMASDWEADNGLDPYDDGSIDPDNGAAGDMDEDGICNLDEYRADTNPLSSQSALRIGKIVGAPAGVDITFQSKASRVYELQGRSLPKSSTWEAVTDEVTGIDGDLTISDIVASNQNSKMYRIGAFLP